MKLTNYILDLGRVVAYYPGLKKVTGSTTATIMLCQFLYWSNKTKDGWIWKTAEEIEEETGLTKNEQRTAKQVLSDLNLLEYERKRLDHTSKYRINQDELNKQWEQNCHKESERVEEVVVEEPVTAEEILPPPAPVETVKVTAVKKKGDLIDGLLAYSGSKGMAKMNKIVELKDKIEKRLHINATNKKWTDFIEFAYVRETKYSEALDKFIDYALRENFNPIYWTPEKMTTLWPQAFIKEDFLKPRDDFVQKLPEAQEEEYAPMPKDIGRRREF